MGRDRQHPDAEHRRWEGERPQEPAGATLRDLAQGKVCPASSGTWLPVDDVQWSAVRDKAISESWWSKHSREHLENMQGRDSGGCGGKVGKLGAVNKNSPLAPHCPKFRAPPRMRTHTGQACSLGEVKRQTPYVRNMGGKRLEKLS